MELVDSGLATRMRLELIETEIEKKCEPYHLKPNEIYVLYTIYTHDGCPTPKEVAESLGQHLRTTNAILKQLTDKGMIVVKRSNINKDYCYIRIREEGFEVMKKLFYNEV